MAMIGINDLTSGHALFDDADSFVAAIGNVSDAELKAVVGGSKSSGGGTVAIVNNIAYGLPYGGGIFGPVTNIVAGGDD
jgi:hypothetical protein